MVIANSRERLWIALDNQTKVLQKIIADGLAETTKPRDRLAIFKTLGEISEELSEKLQTLNQDSKVEMQGLPTVVFRMGKITDSYHSRFLCLIIRSKKKGWTADSQTTSLDIPIQKHLKYVYRGLRIAFLKHHVPHIFSFHIPPQQLFNARFPYPRPRRFESFWTVRNGNVYVSISIDVRHSIVIII